MTLRHTALGTCLLLCMAITQSCASDYAAHHEPDRTISHDTASHDDHSAPMAAAQDDISDTFEICTGFGPQTPRDISQRSGANTMEASFAPAASELNLCNIHFHKNAEHKGPGFSITSTDPAHGGYMCDIAGTLTDTERSDPGMDICHGLKPGDTIEVHWVHSSCDITPGPTLGSCLSEACSNPQLRVETQVFTLVNDPNALSFDYFTYDGYQRGGFHQAKALPGNVDDGIEFIGSTTGPKYTQSQCSPYIVTWNVRPQCAKLNIKTLGKWCSEGNAFDENHAHGVRKLVTAPNLLSEIH